jgi:hypothetical protein
MNNRRRGKTLTTNIPIYSLSGGVGRQAPSKRLPSESQELINTLCSVERSIEKRPGTDLMPIRGSFEDAPLDTWTAESLGLVGSGSYEFFWHSLSDAARYLFVVDRGASDSADLLYYVYYFNQTLDYFEDHTPSEQSTIDADVRAYITYGASPLKLVTRGQNLIFLNPDVYAGYTSKKIAVTTDDWYYDPYTTNTQQFSEATEVWVKLGLNGQVDGDGSSSGTAYIIDTKGAKEEYLSAIKVDPQGIATIWDPYSTYVAGTTLLYIPGTQDWGGGHGAHGTTLDFVSDNAYNILSVVSSTLVPDEHIHEATHFSLIASDYDYVVNPDGLTDTTPDPLLDLEREPVQVPVKDWEYPDSSKPQLGQSLPTFNDLRLPPLESDVLYGNNNAQIMLNQLYGLEIGEDTSPADGTWDDISTLQYNSAEGKVYYIQTSYQGQAPGYYIAKSVTAPHMMKVRTPDEYSLLDDKRMPMQLEFVGGDSVFTQWEWSKLEWAERTSGDKETNPGPTPFKNGKQAKLSTIAFFRNRLWLSSGDVIFSSQENNYTNLWIEDPGIIVDTDPIDIAASTNRYTPITSMVPFKDYMFVNTDADTQYELMGSENQITPFTAELQPMTFYSTAPLVDPLTLGNHIFFYDAERLYLYLGRGGSLSTAQELSAHCPKYLPTVYGATAVAAAQDTIMAVDGNNESDVYLYTTRYRGNEIVQNAFYKFNYEDAAIKSIKAWENYAYMVVERDSVYHIERQHLRYDDIDIPRLDRKQKITMYPKSSPLDGTDLNNPIFDATAFNCHYSVAGVETTVRIPYVLDANEQYDFVDTAGVSYNITSITPAAAYTDITVVGNVTSGDYWIGRSFTMLIQMSTQFLRNEQNNPQEGILNIASLLTRHYNTGNYDVVVQRRGRPVDDIRTAYESRDPLLSNFTTSFAAPQSDEFVDSNLSISNIEYQGELVSKIMGFSDKIEIFILSDYFTPVKLTNLQVKGKFKATYSGVL